ncbi:MAG: phosphatase PAP2 family protein [Velocimicrobium sp.]
MTKETAFGKWYKKSLGKWVPQYGIFSLIICFAINSLVYSGSQQLMKHAYHYNLTSAIDRRIPFAKEWVIIYLSCYTFWIFNYILISREGKEKWYRFVTADLMSRLICGVLFVLLPTTNIRPPVIGNDVFSVLVRFVYQMDMPTNLFPSIHCLVSWFCFVGIRKSEKIPKWYKVFSCIFALLVCASTQFTKQHYLVDLIGGIVLAELCYYIANHTHIYCYIKSFFDMVERKAFGETDYNE